MKSVSWPTRANRFRQGQDSARTSSESHHESVTGKMFPHTTVVGPHCHCLHQCRSCRCPKRLSDSRRADRPKPRSVLPQTTALPHTTAEPHTTVCPQASWLLVRGVPPDDGVAPDERLRPGERLSVDRSPRYDWSGEPPLSDRPPGSIFSASRMAPRAVQPPSHLASADRPRSAAARCTRGSLSPCSGSAASSSALPVRLQHQRDNAARDRGRHAGSAQPQIAAFLFPSRPHTRRSEYRLYSDPCMRRRQRDDDRAPRGPASPGPNTTRVRASCRAPPCRRRDRRCRACPSHRR